MTACTFVIRRARRAGSPRRRTSRVAIASLALLTTLTLASAPVCAQAVGDFNGDGFADLAIGVPGEDIGAPNAGAVHIIYGAGGGLRATGDQIWHQQSPFVAGFADPNDRFGSTLAVGDFNNDGFDDLAIGIPGDTVNDEANVGSVTILYGLPSGLHAAGNQNINLSYDEMPLHYAANDRFGAALAVGDFDNDGFADLAVGVPGHAALGRAGAGAVVVIFGGGAGLDTHRAIHLDQTTPGIADNPEVNDHFGAALAAGNFNNDEFDDLAIGVPGEDLLGAADAGAVHVLYGAFFGPDPATAQFWSQQSNNIRDRAEAGDRFGSTLAAGDFDADGMDDLAIGVPGEDLGAGQSIADTGAVHLLFGRSNGLRPAGNRLINQNGAGNRAKPEPGDNFGAALAFGDFDGDGFDDLVIAAHGQSTVEFDTNGPPGRIRAGAVYVFRGNAQRSIVYPAAPLHQTGGPMGAARANDRFGTTLAVGDFNGDGIDDLMVGIPHKHVGRRHAGAVIILQGRQQAQGMPLRSLPGQIWTQNVAGIANTPHRDDLFGGANMSP